MKKKRPKKASSLSVEYLSQNVILTHHLLMDAIRRMESQVATLRRDISALRVELRGRSKPTHLAISDINTDGKLV